MGAFGIVALIGFLGIAVASLGIYYNGKLHKDEDSPLGVISGVFLIGGILAAGTGTIIFIISAIILTGMSGNRVADLNGLYTTAILPVADPDRLSDNDFIVVYSEDAILSIITDTALDIKAEPRTINEIVAVYNTTLYRQRFNEQSWIFWPTYAKAPSYLKPVVIVRKPTGN